jgi:hypothetical protein
MPSPAPLAGAREGREISTGIAPVTSTPETAKY